MTTDQKKSSRLMILSLLSAKAATRSQTTFNLPSSQPRKLKPIAVAAVAVSRFARGKNSGKRKSKRRAKRTSSKATGSRRVDV